MNRRSFLKRLGLIPAAIVGAKLVENLPAKAAPEVPLATGGIITQPVPLTGCPGFAGPIWVSPPSTWGGWCPDCAYPTTTAAHTHNTWSTYTVNSNTANFSGFNIS